MNILKTIALILLISVQCKSMEMPPQQEQITPLDEKKCTIMTMINVLWGKNSIIWQRSYEENGYIFRTDSGRCSGEKRIKNAITRCDLKNLFVTPHTKHAIPELYRKQFSAFVPTYITMAKKVKIYDKKITLDQLKDLITLSREVGYIDYAPGNLLPIENNMIALCDTESRSFDFSQEPKSLNRSALQQLHDNYTFDDEAQRHLAEIINSLKNNL